MQEGGLWHPEGTQCSPGQVPRTSRRSTGHGSQERPPYSHSTHSTRRPPGAHHSCPRSGLASLHTQISESHNPVPTQPLWGTACCSMMLDFPEEDCGDHNLGSRVAMGALICRDHTDSAVWWLLSEVRQPHFPTHQHWLGVSGVFWESTSGLRSFKGSKSKAHPAQCSST